MVEGKYFWWLKGSHSGWSKAYNHHYFMSPVGEMRERGAKHSTIANIDHGPYTTCTDTIYGRAINKLHGKIMRCDVTTVLRWHQITNPWNPTNLSRAPCSSSGRLLLANWAWRIIKERITVPWSAAVLWIRSKHHWDLFPSLECVVCWWLSWERRFFCGASIKHHQTWIIVLSIWRVKMAD